MKKYSLKSLSNMLENSIGNEISERMKTTLRLVYEGHRGQFRVTRNPDFKVPFVVHPVQTAILVAEHYGTVQSMLEDDFETVICVALAHDLLEDTHVERTMLENVVGARVLALVESLTKPPADIAGKSKDKRNNEFVEKIIKAGATAVFVKLCDSMDNMSKPNITPCSLFEKTVNKSANFYLPMLTKVSLGSAFLERYQQTLDKAKNALLVEKKYESNTEYLPQSLPQALKLVIGESSGKILELHDIVDILTKMCAPLGSSIWKMGGKHGDTITLVSATENIEVRKNSFQLQIEDAAEALQGNRLGKIPVLYKKECSEAYLVPVHIGPDTILLVILGFDEEGPPLWLDIDTALFIVQFLAHRLIVSEAERRSQIAAEAAKLGVQLNLPIASKLGVTPPDLARICHWQKRCDQALCIVKNLIEVFLLSRISEEEKGGTMRIEARVKSINSILQKTIRQKSRSFLCIEEMEDVAGLRVVCPTQSDASEIQEFLCGDIEPFGCRLHRSISQPVRDFISKPTGQGYRAVHLILEVSTKLVGFEEVMVACEVQLRTDFQDAWAKIAQRSSYKAGGASNENKTLLSELSETLSRCDEISEKIACQT